MRSRIALTFSFSKISAPFFLLIFSPCRDTL
nr:MAG TPA: hypothetical protein [Caudoviricetes sp.]